MKEGDQRTNEADHAGKGNNYFLDNPSASTISTQDTMHGMGNRGRFPSAKCEWRNRLKDEYSAISDGKWIRRTCPRQNSNRNVSSDCALRGSEHAKAIKFREDQHQFFQHRDARREGNTIHPDAPQYSLNTRSIFPIREEWYYRMTDEEYTLFMKRQQLRMKNWPVQDSNRNPYYNFRSRLDEHKKVQKVDFMEDHPQFLQRRDTRSVVYARKPSIQQSSLNTRQVSYTGYGWQYGMRDEEYNWNMSRQLSNMRSWPAPDPSKNGYFAFKPRVHEHTKAQEGKSREGQYQFFQHRDARRDRNIMYIHPNTHHSSLNTRQVLPTRGGWHYRMPGEERNLAVREQQFRIRPRTLSVKGLDRNAYFNCASGLHEYPKEQKIKSMKGQQKISQHSDTPRSCRATIGSRTDHTSNKVTTLSEKDGLEHRTREEYNPVIARRQLRMKSRPMTDSSGNAYSGTKPNVQEHPKLQKIKCIEAQNQFLQCRNTRSDENVIQHTNSSKYNPPYLNSRPSLPENNGRQHHRTSKEYALFMGGQQLRLEERDAKVSNKNAESEDRPRMCENSPKEQEIKFYKGLRRRKMGNKAMRYPIDRTTKSHIHYAVIDGHHINKKTHVQDSNGNAEFDNKSRIFKEPLDAQLMDSNEFSWSRYLLRMTRIAEDYWSLLQNGLYRTDCILMLIIAIVLGTFLYFIH